MASRLCLAWLFITSLEDVTVAQPQVKDSIISNNHDNYPNLLENLSRMVNDKTQTDIGGFTAKNNDRPVCHFSWKEWRVYHGSYREQAEGMHLMGFENSEQRDTLSAKKHPHRHTPSAFSNFLSLWLSTGGSAHLLEHCGMMAYCYQQKPNNWLGLCLAGLLSPCWYRSLWS